MTEKVETTGETKEPILAPEEIDALMQAVVPSEEMDALFATFPPVAQPKEVEHFDFISSDVSGPDRYPLFKTLQQRMEESLEELWEETFQRDLAVTSVGIEQRVYENILEDHEENLQVYFVYDVRGFGRMAIACELKLVIAYIDAMLGGYGETFEVGSDALSPVEIHLARRVAKAYEKLLVNMWAPVCDKQYNLLKIEVESQFLAIASSQEVCFSVQYEIELSEDLKGKLSLHYPRTFLEPVLDKLRTVTSDEPNIVDEAWEFELEKSLKDVPITARLEFGQCHLDIQQFLALRAGDFLPLRKPEHEPAILWLGSKPLFEAMPGSQDGTLAAELLASLSEE